MANRLQHLRGSEAEHSTFTGAKGEISLVTDTSADRIPTGEVRVHDGTTAGGLPLTLGTTSKPLTNNIVLSSGVGINFNNYGSEDSNSATTVGSNLLDDYEEGTFNVSFTASVGVTCTCYYVKIGNTVFFGNDTVVLGVGSSTSLTFSGSLPFVPNSGGTAQFGLLRTVTNSLTYNIMLAWNKDSSNLYLYQMNNDDTSISGDTITKDARTDLYVTFNGFFLTD